MSTTKLVAPAGSAGRQITTAYGNYTVASDLTVTVDSRAVGDLLNAGYVLFSDDLPVGKAVVAGSHTVTSDEATANAVVIATGLTTIDVALAQVLNAGNVATSDADITWADGDLTIADGSTYNTVAGYVINWVAYGAG